MFTNFFKISFFSILLFISSCGGLKKSWEESGVHTIDREADSTYVWKKGKQFIAIVQTIPVQGRDRNKTIHPINISSETIARSFSKLNYTISVGGISPDRLIRTAHDFTDLLCSRHRYLVKI